MTLHTSILTLTPPSGDLYAAVQVEDADGRILGAAPAFRMEGDGQDARMVPLERVRVDCDLEPAHTELRAVWAYEDSTIPNEIVETSPRRRLGGSR
jgi:hypothetical protein